MSTKLIGLKPVFVLSILVSLTAVGVAGCSMSHDKAKEKAVGAMIEETAPSERAAALTEMMTTTLNLNESQQASVAALNLDYSTRFNILMSSTNPKLDKKKEFTRLSAEKEAKLKGILDDAQRKTYDANKAELLDTYRIM